MSALAGSCTLLAVPGALASDPPQLAREIVQRVDLYGRFDGYLGLSGSELGFANNGSRFGLKAEQPLGGGFALFAGAEWSIKLGEGDSSYNLSQNPDSGFGTVSQTSSNALGTRLGFVGVELGEYGKLTLGKQWSVYYDISQWTDRFTVFGATGSSTYNAGTDGGQLGTGRADDAVAYRVRLGPLQLGAQVQVRVATSQNIDSVAGSLVYDTGFGLQAGVAYSRAFLDHLPAELVGWDGADAQAVTFGVSYRDRVWTAASVNTWTRNHEAVSAAQAAVVYDTLGAELFLARTFAERVMVYAGFDLAQPRQLDPRFVDPNFATRNLLLGARWLFDAKRASFAYLEARTGDTVGADGASAANTLVLGLRFIYSLRDGLGGCLRDRC